MGRFRQYLETVATQQLRIRHIDPENDWELAAQVERIARSSQVQITFVGGKDVSIVAYIDEGQELDDEYASYQVVGGVADKVYNSEDGLTYDFDVVVDPRWQGIQNIGFQLINAAIAKAQSNECHLIRTHVVNKRLLPILVTRYGFDGWDDQRPTPTAILYKYL